MNIDSILYSQRLYIDESYEYIATKFCNLAGAETSRTQERFVLKNWYEGYIYTLLLGIRIGSRENYRQKKDKAPKWSINYTSQFKYALALLLSHKDILNELNLLEYENLVENYNNSQETISKIKSICDEYSNGGLKFLSELYEKDNSIFDDYNCLSSIMKNALEKE